MHSGVATCAGGALTGVVHAGTGTTSIVTPSAIERWASAVPPVPCQLATQVLILVALSPTECFFCYLKKFPDSPSRSGTLSFAPPCKRCRGLAVKHRRQRTHCVLPFTTENSCMFHRGCHCCCCRLRTASCASVHVELGPAL
jgi:hypothetical protein